MWPPSSSPTLSARSRLTGVPSPPSPRVEHASVSYDIAGEPLEGRRLGQRGEAERRDRRHPVAADQPRRVNPDEAVDEPLPQQRGGEPPAAFDEDARQAPPAERSEHRGQIEA